MDKALRDLRFQFLKGAIKSCTAVQYSGSG